MNYRIIFSGHFTTEQQAQSFKCSLLRLNIFAHYVTHAKEEKEHGINIILPSYKK
jgi:hypothetical protein